MLNKKGYTLIELIISAAIISFLITGMVIMLLQQQRQFNFTKEIADIDTTGRTLLGFIASEIRNAGAGQGKAFSLKFINGGSDPDNPCTQASNPADPEYADVNTGTINSPPDCLIIYTWDLTAGMTTQPELNLASTTESSLFINNNGSNGLIINLPENYFEGSEFIGKVNSGHILLGFRSRQNLCNPNIEIQRLCDSDPSRCSECAMIFRADLNTANRTARTVEVIEHNFPAALFPDRTDLNSFINGVDDLDSNNRFGFLNSIQATPMEMSIIRSRAFRVDTVNRGLRMAENLGNFTTIAGGGPNDGNQGILDAPGVVDMQFVFNLQDPDGETTRIGICNTDENNNAICNNTNQRTFSDFARDTGPVNVQTFGREQDIRSVDITLVLKSKIRPQQQKGGFYKQIIPRIADVAERIAPREDGSENSRQSIFNEPGNGFIYRVYTTRVYIRNLAREEKI